MSSQSPLGYHFIIEIAKEGEVTIHISGSMQTYKTNAETIGRGCSFLPYMEVYILLLIIPILETLNLWAMKFQYIKMILFLLLFTDLS